MIQFVIAGAVALFLAACGSSDTNQTPDVSQDLPTNDEIDEYRNNCQNAKPYGFSCFLDTDISGREMREMLSTQPAPLCLFNCKQTTTVVVDGKTLATKTCEGKNQTDTSGMLVSSFDISCQCSGSADVCSQL